MCRVSSPAMYSRCWTNSTENPRYGDLWSPTRRPSTICRALRPSASARARTSGWRRCEGMLNGDRLGRVADELLHDLLDRHPLALGGEVQDEPVPQHRAGDRDDVVTGHVVRAAEQGVRLR